MRFTSLATLLVLLAAPAFATTVDLTTPNSHGFIGSAEFSTNDRQSAGTGVIEPFLRVQANPTEHGFNSDGPLNGDLSQVKGGTWTHSVAVEDLAIQNFGSGDVIQLFLDVNQAGSSPLISLDELRLYTASSPNITSLAQLGFENLVYDMGFGNRVLLNHNLESGSGSGDMTALVPASGLAGHDAEYFYLYCKFGTSGAPYTANSGFEEWAGLLKKK